MNKLYTMRDILCQACYQSIAYEPCIWPYFGLANFKGHSAHSDMDYSLMLKSAQAIVPFFYYCFNVGLNSEMNSREKIYVSKQIGFNAETAMYKATDNVNTHKGTIFILSTLCIALGILFTDDYYYPNLSFIDFADKLFRRASTLYTAFVKDEIRNFGNSSNQTYGEWAYCKYGILGIRGLITSNFKTLKKSISLFQLYTLQNQNTNLALSHLRLFYLAHSDDTNIIKRAGINNASKLKNYAKLTLNAGGMFTNSGIFMVKKLDRFMLKKKWSAAASGDLMIAFLFLESIYESIYQYDSNEHFKIEGRSISPQTQSSEKL